ncbi:response regulator transcription factor [bacterium]|jgi:DNA-binding NarL/FixJ family response regulator|nr:response regulator transcription factor [bacterium]
MRSANPLKVYVIDDHPVVRQGLVDYLGRQKGLELCGKSESGEIALEEIPGFKPDLVILDLSLQGMDGIDVLLHLRDNHPQIKVLVLSMYSEETHAARAIRAGASGYITKDVAIEKILEAIQEISKGKIYLKEGLIDSVVANLFHRRSQPWEERMQSLTKRELQVFEGIGKGISTGNIARELKLSIKTVETYRARIKEKLSLKNGTELMHRAILWKEKHKTGAI